MKQLIIAAILCVGLGAQSSGVVIGQQPELGQVVVSTATVPGGSAQQLNTQEMITTVGGDNLTGCWTYTDAVGDLHRVCCLDLWIITVCAGVNWSAIERLLEF